MLSTILLVSHGSRDPRPQLALEQLAQNVGKRLAVNYSPISTKSVVGTGVLELAPIPLSAQIQEFGEYSHGLGINQVQILPLFLLPGVHVNQDIPAEVAIAQKSLGTKIQLQLIPHLGNQLNQISVLLKNQMMMHTVDTWILLSHGSRRPGGNQPIIDLAHQLPATAAYWSVPPHLESQIQKLLQAGHQKIGILPYFLFSGRTTDAIAHLVDHLNQQFPHSQLHLTPPLDNIEHLSHLIWNLLQSHPHPSKTSNPPNL